MCERGAELENIIDLALYLVIAAVLWVAGNVAKVPGFGIFGIFWSTKLNVFLALLWPITITVLLVCQFLKLVILLLDGIDKRKVRK